MIVLINGGPSLDRFGSNPYLGRLISPRCGNVIRPGEVWAADNDAFLAWDEERFRKMLSRVRNWPGCLFVACPDVVGNARVTLERFAEWQPRIQEHGLPVALVGQDSMEDYEIPWTEMDAFFVGGSTAWKLSAAAADLMVEANRRDLWTHMGRVNSQRRLRIANDIGCKSVDGTGWSMFPDKYLRLHIPYIKTLKSQKLFTFGA